MRGEGKRIFVLVCLDCNDYIVFDGVDDLFSISWVIVIKFF